MNIIAMSLTNGTLTAIVSDNGAIKQLPARSDHPKWTEILEAYKANNTDRILTLLSMQAVIEEYSVGMLSINATGVTYRGQHLHTVDSMRVMAFLREGLPYQPIANYIARKMANPSARAITEMYSFLENMNMPLTPEGKIIAYKGVQFDFYSVTGNKDTIVLQGTVNEKGQILNAIGNIIEIERSSCDDNFRNGCSFGLHAGSLAYAKGFGQRLILVEIDPADVVSVPEDCSCQKLRCCKYKVIGEFTGTMPDTYTTEFAEKPSGDPEKCGGCGFHPDDCECHNDDDDVCEYCGTGSCNSDCACVTDRESPEDKKMRENEAWLYEAMKAEGSLPTQQPFICSPSNPECAALGHLHGTEQDDESYMKGMGEGMSDRIQNKFPTYISGDDEGADSQSHSSFIRGYIAGYA